jgi:hypothetical protein
VSCFLPTEALYRLVYQLGARLSKDEDKAAYKDALLTLLCLRPDCTTAVSGRGGRARDLLAHAKLPRSRMGRGAQTLEASAPFSSEQRSEDNVILKAYRCVYIYIYMLVPLVVLRVLIGLILCCLFSLFSVPRQTHFT